MPILVNAAKIVEKSSYKNVETCHNDTKKSFKRWWNEL